jgi:5'-3' exonuclease
MLLLHTEFLSRVSPKTSSKLVKEFKKSAERIRDNPHQFPYADETDAELRASLTRQLVAKLTPEQKKMLKKITPPHK